MKTTINLLSLILMLFVSSCEKQNVITPKEENISKEETTNSDDNDTSEEKQVVNPTKKVHALYYHFELSEESSKCKPFINVEIYGDKIKAGKVSLSITRDGNSKNIDGWEEFIKDPRSVSYGLMDDVSAVYDEEKHEFFIDYPEKGSKDYIDQFTTRDVISIKYDVKNDLLLFKTKTPLIEGEEKNQTYKLKRIKEHIIEHELLY